MYIARIDEHKKDDVEAGEGKADPLSVDPQAAHLGVRRRLTKEQCQRARGGRRGCPGWTSEEATLAAAEHACSTPRSKWSAERQEHAQSTDAPEGAVGENKVEVRVQPFSCSGTLSDETAEGFDERSAWKATPKKVRMSHLMGAQLG